MANMIAIGIYIPIILVAIAVFMAVRVNYIKDRRNFMFLFLCISVMGWLISDITVLLVTNITVNILIWNSSRIFVGLSSASLFVVLFKFFLPDKRFPRFAWVLLFTLPAITTLLFLTSSFHSLFRTVEHIVVWPRDVVQVRGFWTWVDGYSAIAMTLASTVLVVRAMIKSDNKLASGLFFMAIIMMIAANLLTAFGFIPIDIDPTSMAAGIGLVFMHLALSDNRQRVLFRMFNTLKSRITFPVVGVLILMVIVFVAYTASSTRLLVEDLEAGRIIYATEALYNQQRNLIIISIAGIAVAAVIMFLLIFKCLKPLDTLAQNVTEVANGNLDINLGQAGIENDEIGQLMCDVNNMVIVIKGIVEELTRINHEFNVAGDIDYRADADKYQNAFKEVVESVNEILENQVADIINTLKILNQVADGDFDAEIIDLPGKKNMLPQTLRTVKANLTEIFESATHLAKNAANGRFDVDVDSAKFKGNWAELVSTLNNVMFAVSEPLSQIEHNLVRMSEGDFSLMEAECKGRFDAVKNACNRTNEITLANISEIARILGLMAQGDLTVSTRHDFIGSYAPIKTALTTILSSLNSTLADIQTATGQVVSGAEQISQSAAHLAEGSATQTAAIEDLSSSLALIHDKAIKASSSASSANESTTFSQKNAEEGGMIIKSMTNTMNKIKISSDNISKIIKVIQDIAFQTNLLALNAAVEAARAGEHGKGFTIVADEVRTLARRSQQSTADTSELINNAASSAEEGINAVSEVVSSFETIAGSISGISALISQIAELSAEQLDSIAAVNASVDEINKVVANNSATAEESAAASQELTAQAELLKQKVSFFKIN